MLYNYTKGDINSTIRERGYFHEFFGAMLLVSIQISCTHYQ